MLANAEAAPRPVRYARNTDLDPQLVWRGKDEQDWTDLVVPAPPLYCQEKIHPKALVDDLMRRSKEAGSKRPVRSSTYSRTSTGSRREWIARSSISMSRTGRTG